MKEEWEGEEIEDGGTVWRLLDSYFAFMIAAVLL